MSYIFKTFLRAEKHEFVFSQNRHNSKECHLLAFSKDDKVITVATVDKRKNKAVMKETPFKTSTINKVINYLNNLDISVI